MTGCLIFNADWKDKFQPIIVWIKNWVKFSIKLDWMKNKKTVLKIKLTCFDRCLVSSKWKLFYYKKKKKKKSIFKEKET